LQNGIGNYAIDSGGGKNQSEYGKQAKQDSTKARLADGICENRVANLEKRTED